VLLLDRLHACFIQLSFASIVSPIGHSIFNEPTGTVVTLPGI